MRKTFATFRFGVAAPFYPQNYTPQRFPHTKALSLKEIAVGSSYTDFKGKGFWARDGQVEVWLYLLVEEINCIKAPSAWLKKLQEECHIQATVGFNGCITAGLDEAIDTEEKRNYILELCQSALDKLRNQGPNLTVKAEYSYGADGPDIICNGADYRIHESYAVEFINLLNGKVTTNASTSSMVWPSDVPYGS